MKAVVLGANGFVGSHLCRRLVDAGWQVTAVVRDGAAPRYTRVVGHRADHIDLRIGDATTTTVVKDTIRGADVVLPMYGRPSVQAGEDDPLGDMELHATSHLRILELMRATRSQARIVYPGSRVQYGVLSTLPVLESHPIRPNSIYALHKVLAEEYYMRYFHRHEIPATSLRISVTYGPHQGGKFGIVGKFIERAASGHPIELHGGGNHARDLLYIEDLMDLYCAVLASPTAIGRVFNAGGGTAVTFKTLADTIAGVVGSPAAISVPWPNDAARLETGDYVADITAATKEFGWRPRTSLAAGIRATWAAERSTAGPDQQRAWRTDASGRTENAS